MRSLCNGLGGAVISRVQGPQPVSRPSLLGLDPVRLTILISILNLH